MRLQIMHLFYRSINRLINHSDSFLQYLMFLRSQYSGCIFILLIKSSDPCHNTVINIGLMSQIILNKHIVSSVITLN